MKTSITDLRRNLKRVLDAVDRGEDVTVLYRGKEKAKLLPLNGTSEGKKPVKLSETPFFGMWKDREDMKDPVAWVRKIRRSRIRDL